MVRRTRGVRVFLQHGITAAKNVTPIYARQPTFELPAERFVVASELEQRIVMEDYGYRPARCRSPVSRGSTPCSPRPEPAERADHADLARGHAHRDLPGERLLPQLARLPHHPRFSAARAQQLQVTFLLHPNMRMFADFFTLPNVRLVRQGEVDVQDLLTSSAVLITDFSSVAWDFSFLRRPVLYFQFDRDSWPAIVLRTSTTGAAARTDRDVADSCSAC